VALSSSLPNTEGGTATGGPPGSAGRQSADDPPAVSLEFAKVYEELFPFVWRSVRALGAPPSAIDDITQETFLVVHRRLGEFEGRSSIRTWIYSIARNLVRSHRRGSRGSATSQDATDELHQIEDPRGTPHDTLETSQSAKLLLLLLEKLDEEKREVFVLSEIEQLSAQEVAAIVGANVNTVSSRLRLARAEFSAALVRHRNQERVTRLERASDRGVL
jgi:RNA polymerase sigma-70 factor (ECF subfamily)